MLYSTVIIQIPGVACVCSNCKSVPKIKPELQSIELIQKPQNTRIVTLSLTDPDM